MDADGTVRPADGIVRAALPDRSGGAGAAKAYTPALDLATAINFYLMLEQDYWARQSEGR